jgi:hypothetical protein
MYVLEEALKKGEIFVLRNFLYVVKGGFVGPCKIVPMYIKYINCPI